MLAFPLKSIFEKHHFPAGNVDFLLPTPEITCYRDNNNAVRAALSWTFKSATASEYESFASDIEWVGFQKRYQNVKDKDLAFLEGLSNFLSQEKKLSFAEQVFQEKVPIRPHRDFFKTVLFDAQVEMACMIDGIALVPPPPPPPPCEILQFRRAN